MSNNHIFYSMRSLAQGISVLWKENGVIRLFFAFAKTSKRLWKYVSPNQNIVYTLIEKRLMKIIVLFTLLYSCNFFKINGFSFILQKIKTTKKIELQSLIKLESLFHAFYVCTTHDMSAWTTLVYERCEGV